MPSNDLTIDLERELTHALDELHDALQRASQATSNLKVLVPRLAATGALFDEIEALVHAGRHQIGAAGDERPQWSYPRPTLVVPGASAQRPPVLQPSASFTTPDSAAARDIENSWSPVLEPAPQQADDEYAAAQPGASDETLHCFRLEFESQPGPLDLRTVDDAVSEHPEVRDVALLDYDGRRATLKVWITGAASPSDVQDALKDRASTLFAPDQDVTIVALEDAA
ncbi:MAG: hypothetical protein HY874_03285 [Chloroflexi bacterium]|nr:hypothetical protein [Chloroflexota bacterium]